jgi:hypothetical protein
MKNRLFLTFALIIGLATYANNIWAVSSDSLKQASLSANADLFPFINLTISIIIPSDDTLLTQGNFTVTEDGRSQTIRDFLPPESTGGSVRAVDIVIVHDDSSSLRDEAVRVKANIQSFLADLSASGLDFRVGLVPYGGGGSSSTPQGKILNNGNLYSEGASLIAEIDKMRFSGGTEMAYDAMRLAVRDINWRPSVQKILILITDEDNDADANSPTESELITELQNESVIVYALTNPNDNADFKQIVAKTGGKMFNITADFSIILNEIGASVSAQYLIQYQTDNPTADRQPRTVELTISAKDAQGTSLQEIKTASYTPIPPLTTELTQETVNLASTAQIDNSPIRIVAEIDRQGATASTRAYCFHKPQQEQAFSRIAMTNIGNNLYEAYIPAEKVLAPFVSYYIEAEDAEGKRTLPSADAASQPFVISVLPNESPLITHTTLTTVEEGEDVVISATVTDTTNQVSKVTLYYRKTGRAVYQSVSQAFDQTDVQFTATIPGELVTDNGIQYYLYAEDDFEASRTFGTSDEPNEPQVVEKEDDDDDDDDDNDDDDDDDGGCTLGSHNAPFDPLFPLLVMVSLLYLSRRRLFKI